VIPEEKSVERPEDTPEENLGGEGLHQEPKTESETTEALKPEEAVEPEKVEEAT